MKKAIFFFLLFFISPSLNSFSQELEFNVTISPDVVGIGEEAVISIELNKKVKEIIPSKSSDYDIKYTGVSQQSYVSIVNGKMTSKQSFTYQYIIIPKKTGILNILPFKIISDKTYETSPLKLRVEKQSSVRKKAKDPFDEIEQLLQGSRIKLPEIAVRLIPHKVKVYQNEGVIVDLYLYSDEKEAMDYEYKEASPLRTDKAIYYELSNTFNFQVERVGNYYRKLIRRYVFYPVEAGTLGISPPVFVAISPYGQLKVGAENVGLEVTKLNKGQGILYVGDLTARVEINSNVVNIGENIKLKIKFYGNGNLKIFSTLYNNLKIDGLFISIENVDFKFDKILNNRPYFAMEMVVAITPEKEGEYIIPSVKIDYIDNSLRKKSLILSENRLKVLSIFADKNSEKPVYRTVNYRKNFKFLLFNPFIFIWLVVVTILPIAGLFYNYLEKKLSSDKSFRKRFFANSRLEKFLKDARQHLEKKEYKEFYLALQKAIFYYITDKMNLPTSLSFKEMVEELKNRGINETLINEISDKYRLCQSVYSGKAKEDDAESIFNEVKKILLQI